MQIAAEMAALSEFLGRFDAEPLERRFNERGFATVEDLIAGQLSEGDLVALGVVRAIHCQQRVPCKALPACRKNRCQQGGGPMHITASLSHRALPAGV